MHVLCTHGGPLSSITKLNHSLITASLSGSAAVARVLIEHGACVNQANIDGQTPLILAAVCGHEELAAALLEAGADLSIKTPQGLTALDIATSLKNDVSNMTYVCSF